jgi:multiple sugar transport system substrate-binding protein
MQHDYARMAEWVSKGLLLPLDEYVEAGILDFSNIADSAVASGRVDGKLYGLNLGNNSQAWILDVDAFEKAGIPLPAQNWTWEDFEKITLELHDKLGIWGMGGHLDDRQIWKSLYMGYGYLPFGPDNKSLGYEDDQPLIDHLKMILRLIEAEAIPSHEVWLSEYQTSGPENSALVQGKAAMIYQWSNQITAVWTAAGEDRNLKMVHLPRPKDGCCPSNYFKPSMFFAITKDAKQPKEAAMFIDFFTNSLEANQILMAERGVPISSVVQEGLKASLTAPQQEMFDFLARVAEDNTPIHPPDPAKFSELANTVYNPELVEPVLMGEMTPEEGVAIFREMANELLSQ